MPEILRRNGYIVCVYHERGVRHHLPHCHVKWADKEAVVSLPTLAVIVGDAIPAAGVEILAENIAVLVEHWDRFNGSAERPTRTELPVIEAPKRAVK